MGTVSVVIPNYNNGSYIKRCLEAVLSCHPKEIIVVDDASKDDSVKIIEKFPVQLIKNKENVGPVKSRNIGAKRATGDYLLFLDGDAVVSKAYITSLAEFLDSNPLIGVVSGKIIEAETGERMWYGFGYDPNSLREVSTKAIRFLVSRNRNSRYIKKLIVFMARPLTLNLMDNAQRKVDWVVEMAFMTRRTLFEKIGGLDERFFMFFEGPDYCRRVRHAGYKVWYFSESSATHLGGHSHSSNTRKKLFRNSRILYSKKYFSGGYSSCF